MQETYLGRLGAGAGAGAWAGGAAGCAGSWLRGTLPIRYQMPMLFSSLGNQHSPTADAAHTHQHQPLTVSPTPWSVRTRAIKKREGRVNSYIKFSNTGTYLDFSNDKLHLLQATAW